MGMLGGFGGWENGMRSFAELHQALLGRVVARSGAAGGEQMRCNFDLANPSRGMAGGGNGQCQMPDGKNIGRDVPDGVSHGPQTRPSLNKAIAAFLALSRSGGGRAQLIWATSCRSCRRQ